MPITWNNVPVAYVDPNFTSQIDELKDQSRRIYISSLLGNDTDGITSDSTSEQRKWQMPAPNGWDLDLFNISGISKAFDRDTANKVYMRALTKGPVVGALDLAPEGEGRIADCQAMKIQIDYLAVQERAFRLRHSTSIRCAMHAASRRRGHSTWNDAPNQVDLGAGIAPGPNDVAGPIGGIFTTMIRYILLIINGGYNSGLTDIVRPATKFETLPDGTIVTIPEA